MVDATVVATDKAHARAYFGQVLLYGYVSSAYWLMGAGSMLRGWILGFCNFTLRPRIQASGTNRICNNSCAGRGKDAAHVGHLQKGH